MSHLNSYEVKQCQQALFGVLDVEVDRQGDITISAFEDLNDHDTGSPPVVFNPEWTVDVEEYGERVPEAIIAHMKWVIEQHRDTLQRVRKCLRDAELIEAPWREFRRPSRLKRIWRSIFRR